MPTDSLAKIAKPASPAAQPIAVAKVAPVSTPMATVAPAPVTAKEQPKPVKLAQTYEQV